MQRTTVIERGRLVRGGTETRVSGTPTRRVLPQRLYDRLMRSERGRIAEDEGAIFQERRDHAFVGPWVGVLQIPGLQLELLPKTDAGEVDSDEDAGLVDLRANLMEMLRWGGFGAVRARGMADVRLKRANLHDLLVEAFLDRLLLELRRGLDRTYLSQEANLLTLRGRLLLSRHITKNAAQKTRFFCQHDVLHEATPVSVRLRQACQALSERVMPNPLVVKCRQALAILDDVPAWPFRRGEPEPVFTRQNERFVDLWAFATLILEGRAPDARGGEVETFSLLFSMEQVFERYIAAFMASQVLPGLEGVTLHPQGRGLQEPLYVHEGKGVLRMQPDLLLVHEGRANGCQSAPRRLIIDTKWKRLKAGSAARPSNGDLYQLYAYLHRYGCRRVTLLYPEVPGVAPRDLRALGPDESEDESRRRHVGVRFVNLGGKLASVQRRQKLAETLEELVREGLDLGAGKEMVSVPGLALQEAT